MTQPNVQPYSLPQPAPAAAYPGAATTSAGVNSQVTGVTTFASWLVALVVFWNISRLAPLYNVLAAMQVPLLTTILAAIVVFAQARRWRPMDLTRHWIPKLVLLMVVIAIAGVPTALHRGATFDALLYGYSQSILGAILIFAVARTPKGARLMAQAMAVSGIIVCVLALLYNRRDNTGRLGGAATYDANDLGLIINISLPFLMWWIFDKKSKLRIFVIAAVPLLFMVALRTGSRGGFLGMCGILLGMLFVGLTGRVKEVRRISLTALLLGAIAIPFLPGKYLQRMSTITEETENTSPRSRWQVWQRGIGYAFEFPVVGVGMSNFGRAEGRLSDYSRSVGGIGVKWSAAHSSYVQALAETGLIAGSAFIVLVLCSTFSLVWWRSRIPKGAGDPSDRMLIPIVGLAMIAFMITGAFLSFAWEPPLYYLLGFGLAMLFRPGEAQQVRPGMFAPAPASTATAVASQSPPRPRMAAGTALGLARYPAPPPPRKRRTRGPGA